MLLMDRKTMRTHEVDDLPAGRAAEACGLALKLFLERGFDNTPMSLIAGELGLTKAGVYHHFQSKEHLLYVVHKDTIGRLLVPIMEQAEAIADPEARLRFFVLEYARLLTRDSSARLLISEAKRLSPEHFGEIRRVWRRGFDLVRDAIVALQAQGSCREGLNPTFGAFAAIGMCSWIFYWFDYSRPESGAAVAETMADVFLNGVLRKG
jgi:AcrR family transcriptional regulator